MFNPTPEDVEKAILHYLVIHPYDISIQQDFLANCEVDPAHPHVVRVPAWIDIDTPKLMDILQDPQQEPKPC